ncbi:MAG: GHKL domain-containing protein [Lachnospiraceae bacterium]|nr:GHKL domain-containing protein [Lachnospiraceae bacterium]
MEKEVKIKNGKPVSTGGKGTGIGCLNVERCVVKYGGSVLYKNGDGKFYSDVILNR